MKSKKIYYGWFVTLATFLSTFISVGLAIYSFSIFVVPMSEILSVPRTSITVGSSLFTISMGIVGIFTGAQVAKGYVRRLIAVGIVFVGSGYFLVSMASSLPMFYIAYILIGIGCACTGPVMTSSLLTAWFNKRRGLAVGITSCGASVCAIIMPSLVSTIMNTGGIRTAYRICGLIVVIVLFIAFLIIRPNPQSMGLYIDGQSKEEYEANISRKGESGNRIGLNRGQAMRTITFWMLCIAFAMLGFSQMGVMQNAAAFLNDLSFESQTAARALSFIGLAGVFSTIISGWLADRNPKATFCMGNVVLLIGTMFLLSTNQDSGFGWLMAYALFFGFGMGVWSSSLPLITSGLLGTKYFGAIWGVAFAVKSLCGDSLGAPVVSAIASVIGYRMAFMIPAVFLVLSAVLVLMTRKPQAMIDLETSNL